MTAFAITCKRCGRVSDPADVIEVDTWISPESAEDGEAEGSVVLVCPDCTNREEVDLP